MKTAFDLLKDFSLDSLHDIRRIIAHVKGIPCDSLVLCPEKIKINACEMRTFNELLSRYRQSEPVSKITGKKSFWKYDFFVNKHVLDPRPETEIIIESAMSLLDINDSFCFLDIGTGSGCILLSLLSEFKNSCGIGIDISKSAIDVAEKNKQMLKITNATFVNTNWNDILLHPVITNTDIDIIVSNPPYIRTNDINLLSANVKNYDPLIALDGGVDGLTAYREICRVAKKLFQKNQRKEKYIFFEVGYDQSKETENILKENGFFNISTVKDLAGINRVVIAQGM